MTETTTISFSKTEDKFVRAVLRTADGDNANLQQARQLLFEEMGPHAVAFFDAAGGEMGNVEDPAPPEQLLDQYTGRQITVSRHDLHSIQLLITVYIMALAQGGDPPIECIETIDSIADKIRDAYGRVPEEPEADA